MKKVLLIVLLAIVTAMVLMVACKKSEEKKEQGNSYTCTSCTTTPEAVAANDNSSKGVYKGVVIGSTGTIKFNIANNGSTITATLVIDGVTATLSSNVSWTAGQPYVAPFTGTLNGQSVSITFSVGMDGGSPTITSSDIPGHPNASFTIAKETSNALIESFEGTYNTTKPEQGTFNLILSRTAKLWGASARENGSSDIHSSHGTISDKGELINTDNGVVVATLSGDNVSGSFKDSNGITITVTGKRTM